MINAGIYVLSFLIYRWGVAELHHAPDDAADDRGGRPQRLDLGRYRRILARRGSGCWPRPGSR